MFAEEIRRAIEASPRQALPQVASIMWQAVLNGQISEAEAESLTALIEERRAPPPASKPLPRRVGSRPRSLASVERRRSWASSARMPPAVAARFTQSEAAVLAVLAIEVRRSGDCRWPIGKLGAVAGVSISTVKRALRAARALGLIVIEERRLSAWRSDTNVMRIVCSAWLAWLARGGGGQAWPSTKNRFPRETKITQQSAVVNQEAQEKRLSERLQNSHRNACSGFHIDPALTPQVSS